MPDLGQREDHHRAGRHERRVQALRQVEPVEHQHHAAAAGIADQGADQRLGDQERRDVVPGLAAVQDHLDQHDGEEDRERIVDPGLDLERRADARPQPQPLGVQQEEHRRGVGRGDDRADQQRLGPAEPERKHRRRRGQRGSHQHADGRQQARRADHVAEGLVAGAQTAVEQDQRQRHRSDGVGEPHVVEPDAERPRLARQHADQQEHQQQRRAEAQRHQARQDAGQDQKRRKQNADADRVKRAHCAKSPLVGRFVTGRIAQRQIALGDRRDVAC